MPSARRAQVGLEVITDHDRLGGRRPRQLAGHLEDPERGLADDRGLDPGRVLEPRHERARVEGRPVDGRPPPVALHRDQRHALDEPAEHGVQARIRPALVRAAEQEDVGLARILHELDTVQLHGHLRLDERVHAGPAVVAAQVLAGRKGCGDDPGRRDRHPHPGQPLGDPGARAAGRVREDGDADARIFQARDRLGRALDRPPVDVQDALHVENDAARGAHPASAASSTWRAIGAATSPPTPPFTMRTATATRGASAGAKAMNQASDGRLGPTSAVPVLPATVTPEMAALVPVP
jgi:hypothetical protein